MQKQPRDMSLTLGPVLFNWTPEKWRDFYFRIADEAPIDLVVLGEIVCAKRMPFFAPHLPTVLERLESAGKKVILGAPILVMNKKERSAVDEFAEAGYLVEANDTTALQALAEQRFAIGPFINVYNEAARAFFESAGAERISLTGELSLTSIAAIAMGAITPIEVFGFGRMPLAISARCYHARAHELSKDGCQYVCSRDPDGMDVDTRDGQPFLAVNGVQTLSYTCHSALADIEALALAGVSSLRLSPQNADMVAVARLFRETLDGEHTANEASAKLDMLIDGLPLSNGFLHGKEGFRARGALSDFSLML